MGKLLLVLHGVQSKRQDRFRTLVEAQIKAAQVDIVKRLRQFAYDSPDEELREDAAAEIERLRSALAGMLDEFSANFPDDENSAVDFARSVVAVQERPLR